ncbi:phosphoglucosamine mutase [Candidatus Micrarchaeota archaeon]|nr:phosphoglucosamine mutase [Candidatus Micrarchaeota archaeon]
MLFGTSGIRGVVGKEITSALAFAIGKSLGQEGKTIVIGRDSRKSGVELEEKLVSGIASSKGTAQLLGIAPTPTVALASKKFASTGIMITASHNPPEYNGFKFFENGDEATKQFEKTLEQRISEQNKKINEKEKQRPLEQNAEASRVFFVDNAVRQHIDFILSQVDVEAIRAKNPKVVIDCGNGAGGVITPLILREAGCRVVSVNSEPTGVFARKLEPNEENLKETAGIVAATGALLGIAHDGDADRAIGIDENGKVLGLDEQLVLFCEDALEKKKGKIRFFEERNSSKNTHEVGRADFTIVSTVEASLCVREAVEANNGELLITPVGSREVSSELRKNNAVFGGEPCGEYVYSGELTIPDGIRTALKLVELACRKGKLSELRKKIKKYPMQRAKIQCANEKKQSAMKKIAVELPCVVEGKASSVDGVRVDFEGGWLLVRPSGTEPFMRITCEAKNEKKLKEAFEKAEEIVKKSV